MDDTHLRALLGERHPFTSPASLRRAEDYLTEEFTHLGLEVSTHSFKALGGTYRNVIATLPPLVAARPAPPLIIAAHYDTAERPPGADDNASALAGRLELARNLRGVPVAINVRFLA